MSKINLLVKYLINNNVIEDADIDIVKYGVKSFGLNVSNIICLLLISLIFDDLIIGLLFLIFFIPIRVLIGGYHCSTAMKCFASFNLLFIGIYIVSNYIKYIHVYCYVLIAILLISRNYVSSKKKYLNHDKYFCFKNYVLFMYLIVLIISNSFLIYKSLFMASFLNVILLFLAKVAKKEI